MAKNKKPKPRIIDITIRMRRKDGTPTTREQARKALWAAHKAARRGHGVGELLTHWTIEAVDWRNTYASGKFKVYAYTGAKAAQAIDDMGGLLEEIGMDKLRVEVPDDASHATR